MKLPVMISLLLLLFTQYAGAQYVQKEFMIGANWAPPLALASATPVPADYNGDGKVDLAARINTGVNKGKFQIDFSNAPGEWFSSEGWPFKTTAAIYGTATDFVVPADYDGDGSADIAVFFPAKKLWCIDYKKNGFGKWDVIYNYTASTAVDASAIPMAGQFDEDKKIDISFKTAAGKWLFDYSTNGLGKIDDTKNGYGNAGEHPVPADYDGDKKTDLAVKTDEGVWKIDQYQNGFNGWDITITGCGDQRAVPVPADYNGDGRADISVKTDSGSWKVAASFTNGKDVAWIARTTGYYYGGTEARPFAGDFNGDGKADFSFAMLSDGRWLLDNFAAATNGYDWRSSPGKLSGDYNTASLNTEDQLNFTKLKNAYFNLITDAPLAGLTYDNQRSYYLSLIAKIGLNTMITDPYIYNFGDTLSSAVFDKSKFIARYKNQLAAASKKRIFAVNLGDEPNDKPRDKKSDRTPFNHIKDWTSFFSKQYDGLPTFNNLLPIYGFRSAQEYAVYLDAYKASSSSPFICFDHYPFRTKTSAAIPSYFENLSLIKQKFQDKALWSTVWSALSLLNDIPDPDEKELWFMAFAPIAYGAKGIVYFPYDKRYNPKFKIAINDDTVKYQRVKNINLYLKNIAGPVTIGYKIIATLHKNDRYQYKPPAYELLPADSGLVKDVSEDNILLGLFSKKNISKATDFYVWVMNKDTSEVKNVVVTLRGDQRNRILIAPRVVNYIKKPTLVYSTALNIKYDPSSATTSFAIPVMAACEGIMVKIIGSTGAKRK